MAQKPKKKKEKKSFKEAYQEGYNKFTPHTKNGKATSEWLMSNWSIIPSVLILGITCAIALTTQTHVQARTEQIAKVERQVLDLEGSLANAKGGNNEKIVKKTIDVKTHSAKEAGDEMIQWQTELMKAMDYTLVGADKPLDLEKIKDLTVKIQSKTGFNPSEALATWIKVPSWKMEFKSVATYERSDIPVVFLLKDDKDELMGMVTAIYDSDKGRFSNISVTYTVAGEAVSYNRGGV